MGSNVDWENPPRQQRSTRRPIDSKNRERPTTCLGVAQLALGPCGDALALSPDRRSPRHMRNISPLPCSATFIAPSITIPRRTSATSEPAVSVVSSWTRWQTHTFHETQTGPVEQTCHEARRVTGARVACISSAVKTVGIRFGCLVRSMPSRPGNGCFSIWR